LLHQLHRFTVVVLFASKPRSTPPREVAPQTRAG
jgi:hypothetical protein